MWSVRGNARERRIQSLIPLHESDFLRSMCIVDQRKGFDKATSRHPLHTEIVAKNDCIPVPIDFTPFVPRWQKEFENAIFEFDWESMDKGSMNTVVL
jgi:hypothetical protein